MTDNQPIDLAGLSAVERHNYYRMVAEETSEALKVAVEAAQNERNRADAAEMELATLSERCNVLYARTEQAEAELEAARAYLDYTRAAYLPDSEQIELLDIYDKVKQS